MQTLVWEPDVPRLLGNLIKINLITLLTITMQTLVWEPNVPRLLGNVVNLGFLRNLR